MENGESTEKKCLYSNEHTSKSLFYLTISQEGSFQECHQTSTDHCNKSGDVEKTNNETGFQKQLTFLQLPKRKLMILGYSTLGRLLLMTGVSIFNPIFPIEAREKGIDEFWVKLIFGQFYLVVFICSPLFGRYLIKLGPQFVFYSALYSSGIINVFFALLHYGPGDTPYLVLVILNRSLYAVFRAGYSTVTQTIVLYEFPENVGKTQSILLAGTLCGFVIGPAISGFLFDAGGYCLPFYVIGASILLISIFAHITLPNLDGSIKSCSSKENVVSISKLLKSPLILIALLSCFVGSIGSGNIDTTMTDVLLPFGFSMSVIGLVFVGMDVMNTSGNFAWAYVADSLNRESVAIMIGLFVNFIAFALLGPVPFIPFIPHNVHTICVAVGFIGFADGSVLTPVLKCLIIATIELGFKGGDFGALSAISGLFTSIRMLGIFFGQFVVGLIGNAYGNGVMFTVIAFTNAFVFVLSASVFWARKGGKFMGN